MPDEIGRPKVDGAIAETLSATALLQQFAQDWPDDRTPYRTEGDTSWIAYALTMKRLVAQGDAAVPALLTGCNDPQAQVIKGGICLARPGRSYFGSRY